MNRLIILGNGFDLAHQMKTSYYNFIDFYVRDCFTQAKKTGNYEDELMTISLTWEQRESLIFWGSPDLEYYISLIAPSKRSVIAKFLDPGPPIQPLAASCWTLKHPFIEKLITTCQACTWVDIENEYYDALKVILEEKDTTRKDQNVKALNEAFRAISSKLQTYLDQLTVPTPSPKYSAIIQAEIMKDEIVSLSLDSNMLPQKTMLLNFNYTATADAYPATVDAYLEKLWPQSKDMEFTINHIHGQLNNPSNPIIFGFGDEMDKDYMEIENERNREFLQFVKSFGYFRTSNYHELIKFIDLDDFQVYILGHSCGLSDRTMLNMVFEHEKCKSIKIFYHQTETSNDYTRLTQEISRHFRDKGSMRRKIVPFDRSTSMPQV